MPTDKQRLASQANGAKSRGPVTPEGKLRCSQNGLRHGFCATALILDGEQLEAFEDLRANLLADFNPTTYSEYRLIDIAAMALWRLSRMWEVESAAINKELRRQGEGLPAERAAGAFSELANKTRTLDLLHRYDSRLERQYHRAVNQLRRHREDKTRDSPISNFPTKPGDGLNPLESSDCPDRIPGRDAVGPLIGN